MAASKAKAAAKKTSAKKAKAARKFVDESTLSERQQKWFASMQSSLQRDTGKSLDEWVKIAKKCPETTPGKRTQWLREKYGLGVNRIAHILHAAFPSEGPSWDDPEAERVRRVNDDAHLTRRLVSLGTTNIQSAAAVRCSVWLCRHQIQNCHHFLFCLRRSRFHLARRRSMIF